MRTTLPSPYVQGIHPAVTKHGPDPSSGSRRAAPALQRLVGGGGGGGGLEPINNTRTPPLPPALLAWAPSVQTSPTPRRTQQQTHPNWCCREPRVEAGQEIGQSPPLSMPRTVFRIRTWPPDTEALVPEPPLAPPSPAPEEAIPVRPEDGRMATDAGRRKRMWKDTRRRQQSSPSVSALGDRLGFAICMPQGREFEGSDGLWGSFGPLLGVRSHSARRRHVGQALPL